MYCEIGRILNHLLNLTTFAIDVGAMTPLLWGFEEREQLMGFYERACGARLHAAYFRPGGVHQDLPDGLLDEISQWAAKFPSFIDDLEMLLTDNRIFKQRTVDIGVISEEDALDLGMTGPCLRASGVAWDLRKKRSPMTPILKWSSTCLSARPVTAMRAILSGLKKCASRCGSLISALPKCPKAPFLPKTTRSHRLSAAR